MTGKLVGPSKSGFTPINSSQFFQSFRECSLTPKIVGKMQKVSDNHKSCCTKAYKFRDSSILQIFLNNLIDKSCALRDIEIVFTTQLKLKEQCAISANSSKHFIT